MYCKGKATNITNFLEREQPLHTNCRLKKTHLHASHKNSTFNLHISLSSYRLFQGAETTLVICFQVSIIQLFVVIIIILIGGASPRNQNFFQLFFFFSFIFLSFFPFFLLLLFLFNLSRIEHGYRSFFFSDDCTKQIDSMLPWVCLVTDHRGHQNVVKTSVTHSPAARVPLFCFKHILMSSVIYRAFSLTWPECMLIYWNKRKHLHEKRVQLPEDFLGTPTWLPFHCFGTPIWPP